MLACYQRFINRLKPQGVVIYNADSSLARKLKFPKNSVPYRLADFPENLILSQPGNHNKSNALAITKLAEALKNSDRELTSLSSFRGLNATGFSG
jgi:UDP-N-acetylmuramate-alanine ligase